MDESSRCNHTLNLFHVICIQMFETHRKEKFGDNRKFISIHFHKTPNQAFKNLIRKFNSECKNVPYIQHLITSFMLRISYQFRESHKPTKQQQQLVSYISLLCCHEDMSKCFLLGVIFLML